MVQPESLPADSASPPSPQKRLWVLSVLYFFQFAGIGVYFTYLNVYFREAGLSGTEIGVINMINALVGVASMVLWGYLSDRTGQNRLIIAVGAVGGLLVAQFIPSVHTFREFILLATIGSFLGSAPGTLVDSTALAMLGERREDYGRYRLGGTFGYVVTTFAAGVLFEKLGLQLMFPAYGIVMGFFAGAALLLPRIAVRREEKKGQGAIGQMVRQPAWVLFTACVFLVWIASNASIMFLGVALKSLGASQSLIGTASTVPAIAEIPFMIYSGYLLRRFGTVKLLLVAMTMMMVRYFLLGWMPTPEWAIPINLINGPAFVFFWNSAVTHANKMAPAGMAGTVQGLLSSTTSLAGVVSSLLTGFLFDHLGPNGMFVVMGFSCMAALILFGLGNLAKKPVPVIEPGKLV